MAPVNAATDSATTQQSADGRPQDRYAPIGDYALLGNGFSTALMRRDGSIDWACLRRVDRPSCFGRLLDADRGGYFSLDVIDGRRTERGYLDGSLVLRTHVASETGTATITEVLLAVDDSATGPHRLLRWIEGVAGRCRLRSTVQPRLDYGQLRPLLRRHGPRTVTATGGDEALIISSSHHLDIDEEGVLILAEIDVEAGDRSWIVVESQPAHRLEPRPPSETALQRGLDDTIAWWRNWSSGTRARGRYAEHSRSCAAVLRGLTSPETGAIIAAATASLPERIGGDRNWDYRYSWIRDASLTLDALQRVRHPEIGRAYQAFLLRTAAGSVDDLQMVYGAYGERWLGERELDLEGYRASRPVRVGNAATSQVQLDVYGYIVDLFERHSDGPRLEQVEWRFLRSVVDAAARRWREPDQSIWESRGEPRHYTHSKALLWLALDRGLRLAHRNRFKADTEAWEEALRQVGDWFERGGIGEGGWFTQTIDDPTQAVDANLLQLPILGIIDANDERMVRTVDRIHERLATPEGFIQRYEPETTDDGIGGDEAPFLLCNFWLVEVLAMQDRCAEARTLFDRLLGTANDLRLFAEQYDPAAGELRGNYPQAFTHLAMINAGERLAQAEAR